MNFYAYVQNNQINANDPYGLRDLTPGELNNILKPIFNNTIAYNKIDIQEGSNWNPIAWVALNVLGRPAITLGNTIHFGTDYYQQDYSAPGVTVPAQASLAHETTHVWQNQTNGFASTAIGSVSENVADVNAAYSYKLTNPITAFSKYGVEQQATIVEDYYRVSNDTSPLGNNLYSKGDSLSSLVPQYTGTLATAGLGPDAASTSSSAAGGYLLYPNKPNNNMMQGVYRK